MPEQVSDKKIQSLALQKPKLVLRKKQWLNLEKPYKDAYNIYNNLLDIIVFI